MIKQTIEGKYTTKYIFFNGSEISFKRETSAQYKEDLDKPTHTDKGKYSLVLSCSVGCNIGCGFCHLTQNQKPTQTLPPQEVLQNIKDVISDQVLRYPDLKSKSIKLCWMGEGEPLLHTELVQRVTKDLLEWVFFNGYAKYLDGVDIATSYPKVSVYKWKQDILKMVKTDLSGYSRNPNQDDRSALRLFYSLHDSTQEGRDKLVPVSKPIDVAFKNLKPFCEENGIDFIVHYMFIDTITDSGIHLLNLVDLWRKYIIILTCERI